MWRTPSQPPSQPPSHVAVAITLNAKASSLKIIKITSIFYKLRENLPTVVKKMLYFAFIHSQMAYGNTFSSYLNKLIILNNKILRILQNASRETHVADLYITFNTLTLPNLHKFHILLFMHKFFHHNELLPIFFRHSKQKILIYILTTFALKTNHISKYLLPLWGNVL